MTITKAIDAYNSVNLKSSIEQASPHRMIQMLLEGALKRIATAKGHMQRQDRAAQGEEIGKAISIIGGLQAVLNPEKGGDVSTNLDQLYDFMASGLMEANRTGSVEKLDEIMALLVQIKSGWDAIPAEHHATTAMDKNDQPE
ncbi:flagellar export chaperone FliS [Motiliproteus sp. SC1-56]|uniref:flagellar export chaperone FliS n=1 Tax=Motiliproteus sp. SC1-56 TaxID=2799565 RepID=UPI001A900915|nr:flagellar export chaperone FliS [Motiliproteus sp. SC1-56]